VDTVPPLSYLPAYLAGERLSMILMLNGDPPLRKRLREERRMAAAPPAL
jgi:hypothetical protein